MERYDVGIMGNNYVGDRQIRRQGIGEMRLMLLWRPSSPLGLIRVVYEKEVALLFLANHFSMKSMNGELFSGF